jgi:DNA-binding transcriptional MerR regulator
MSPQRNTEESESATLTIGDLAERVGMTVRNLREWRTLGLLPPAQLQGRVGYYDEAVVGRVERIKRLHEQGFPLELIRRMLEASDGYGDDVMGLASALRAPFRAEAAPVVDLVQLARRWGSVSPTQLRRAEKLGLIRKRRGGRYEFTSARVARVGDALHGLGLSLKETLDATAAIRAHADEIAELFEGVWMRHIWEPFLESGAPEERLPALRRTLAEVQPLALDAVIALFTVAMEAKIEEGIAREVERELRKRQGASDRTQDS